MSRLPLDGIRVVEISHMVMGPTCGMILGDLGAEVIKIEPTRGDGTRRLLGAGAGFFRTFNRNKQCIAVDLDTPQGREAVLTLIDSADVFIENFKPGRMHTLGFDYATLRQRNPLFMPALGDSVRVASDMGMYGQTFLLSLTAHGLAGIPQTLLGMYADTVREVLGIDPEMKMLFGISFGYADRAAAANDMVVGRIPVSQSVTFHG